jgi:hypothetical protein
MIISWFSCGVTSAIATKLAIEKYGKDNVKIIYFKIDQVHDDNTRFISECEQWFGKEVTSIQGEFKTPLEVAYRFGYVNGPAGSRCTLELKKKLRQNLEKEMEYDGQVFGFEYSKKEMLRATRFSEQYPSAKPLFPLIDAKITKKEALFMLEKVGIKKPSMYELGYHNNNCIGCFKGGMGYWNKIRKDFPEVFAATSEMEEKVGYSCIKNKFLKDLKGTEGRDQVEIMPDCGNFCDIEYTDRDLLILNCEDGI